MVNPTWEKIKEPVTGFAGVGTGLVVSDLAAEYTARAIGQTGYKKAGVKTLVKAAIGLLLIGISMRVSGSWVLFSKVAAYTSWGSTILDWIAARIPGGIEGIANSFAVATRKWAMGTKKVAAELARLENRPIGAEFHLPFENTHTKSVQELERDPGVLTKNASPRTALTPRVTSVTLSKS